jgi:Domain of unknown function (DUF4226)
MTGAAQTTTAAGELTDRLSGALVDAHHIFVERAVGTLGSAGRTDAMLNAHLARAAALTQTGANRLDAIAAQTHATSQAAATMSTPAGQRAILTGLRSQLTQASDVVNATQQQAGGLAGQLRALRYPRRTEPHPGGADGDGTATSPDDQIVGPPNSGDSTVRLVDNITRGPLPQNPPPPPPTPTSPSDDAITQPMLPPPTATTTPASDPIRTWVDNMVRELAARPDDPIAVEARRMAWEALHKPQQCSTLQWTRDAGGLLLSLGGAGVTIAGAPLGPADWAALGLALGGAGLSYGDLIDCATR